MYTIYYERDGNEHQVPMVFGEKHPAMDCACLRTGFREFRVRDSASGRLHAMTIGARHQLASTVRP
jgi:hypothetical protein